MDFNPSSAIHLAAVLTSTFFIIIIIKTLFILFHVKTARTRILNSSAVLLALIISYQFELLKWLPGYQAQEFNKAFYFAIITVSVYLFMSIVDLFIWNGILKRGNRPGAPKILTNLLSSLIYFITLLTCASNIYHMNVGSILAATGLITVILGYASQSTLSNLFAGIALQFGGKVKKGHYIMAGEYKGVVREFNWRSVTLVGFRTTVIPNTHIANKPIEIFNSAGTDSRLQNFLICKKIPVSITENVSKMVEIARQTAIECSPCGNGGAALSTLSGTKSEILIWTEVPKDGSGLWNLKVELVSALYSRSIKNNIFTGAFKNPIFADNDFIHKKLLTQHEIKPSDQEITEAISNNTILSSIEQEDIHSLIEHAQIQFFMQGENIINQESCGDSLFIIISGELSTSIIHKGLRKKMTRLKPSELFGLKSLLTGEKRRVTVRVDSDIAWLAEISSTSFKSLIEHKPSILDQLQTKLVKREQENAVKVKDIELHAKNQENISLIIKERIARLFGNKSNNP